MKNISTEHFTNIHWNFSCCAGSTCGCLWYIYLAMAELRWFRCSRSTRLYWTSSVDPSILRIHGAYTWLCNYCMLEKQPAMSMSMAVRPCDWTWKAHIVESVMLLHFSDQHKISDEIWLKTYWLSLTVVEISGRAACFFSAIKPYFLDFWYLKHSEEFASLQYKEILQICFRGCMHFLQPNLPPCSNPERH